MLISNKDIMANARSQLKGKWGSVILVVFIYLLISILAESIPKIGEIITWIISGPLAFGLNYYFLSFIRQKNPALEDLFKGVSISIFGEAFIAYIFMTIFIILWTLLLIVPGVIAAISYSMTFFILVDNPEISGKDAIKKSKELIKGNKYKYFCFLVRFLGWFLLSILSFGIGFIWLIPYFMVSHAKFYESLINPDANQSASE
jgi:uncharacterized membrane protein